MDNQIDPQETVDSEPTQDAPPGASVLQSMETSPGEIPRVRLPGSKTNVDSDHEPSGERYRILEEIARGGMGAVHRGHDADLGRDIAVKVLLEKHEGKSGMLARFVEEAQIGGQLQHPGIVPVYELGTFPDRRPYFTMKLVKGQTLSEHLRRRTAPNQDLPRFLKIFEQVCQTMAYAHSHRVLHRDLKPANIMVGAFSEVQVMDWGLAKILREDGTGPEKTESAPEESVIRTQRDSDASDEAQTQSGSVLGTPAYMPPEQAIGEIERLDERADVFGLGAILCEILTGKPPYVGKSGAEVHRKAIRADLDEAFERLEKCGADNKLIQITKQCLSPEPEDRPSSAKELADELTAHLESVESRLRQSEVEAAEARAHAAGEAKRFRLTMALAITVVLLLVVGGGGWAYLANQEAARRRDTLARQDKAARQVEKLLGRAESLRQEARAGNDAEKWASAQALTTQAKGLLTELPAGNELRDRVLQLSKELEEEEKDRALLEQLEAVWLTRSGIDAQSARVALRQSLSKYPPLFASHGLNVGEDKAKATDWLRRRPSQTREKLIAGLDAWLGLARQFKSTEAGWLFTTLQAADEDDWRRQLRAAVDADDQEKVDKLAQSETMAGRPAQTVLLLADYFRPRSRKRAEELLRNARARFPNNFWVNFALADLLAQKHFTAIADATKYEDVVRFLTVAVALRPNNLQVQTLLGWSLWLRGQNKEGRATLERVIARDPNYVDGYNYLGNVYMLEGANDKAEVVFRKALKIEPRSGTAHAGLGAVLWCRGEYAEGMLSLRRAYRYETYPRGALLYLALLGCTYRLEEMLDLCEQVVEDQPEFVEAQLYQQMGRMGASRQYELGLRIAKTLTLASPRSPEPYLFKRCFLGALLRLEEAREASEQALKLTKSANGANFPVGLIELFVSETKMMGKLNPNLPAFAKGDRTPQDSQELMVVMSLFWAAQQYADAAQVYSRAFKADPTLVEDVRHERRFDAARYAIRAADGKGKNATLNQAGRDRWRVQALEWLEADLAGWRKILTDGTEDDQLLARERLNWWRKSPLFANVREPEAREKLPTQEQERWRALWSEVSSLAKAP